MYLNWKDTVWVKLHCRNLLFFFMKAYTLGTQRCTSHSYFSLSRLGLFSIYYFNIHGLFLRRLLIGCKFQLSMEQEAAGACVRAACSSLFSQEGALFIHLKAARRSTAPSLRLSLALRLKLCVLRPVFVSSSRLAGAFSPSLSVQTSCCHYPPPIPCQTSIEFASKPCNTITVFDRKTCHLISTCWSTQVTAAVFSRPLTHLKSPGFPFIFYQPSEVQWSQFNSINSITSPLCTFTLTHPGLNVSVDTSTGSQSVCLKFASLTVRSVRWRPADVECMRGQRGDQWCRNTLRGALLSLSLAGWTQRTASSGARLRETDRMVHYNFHYCVYMSGYENHFKGGPRL